MRNVLFSVLMFATLIFCQNYATVTAEIEVLIPGNQVVSTVQVYIEERTLDTEFIMGPGITLAELLALNPVVISQTTSMQDTVLLTAGTLADQKYWRVAAVGFNSSGQAVTNIPVSNIVRKPLSYEQATIFINLRFR